MNKPLLHQTLDALLASLHLVERVWNAGEIFSHMAAIKALDAELAKPETVIWLHVSDTKMPWDKTLPYKLDFEKDESWACAVQLRATISAPIEPSSQTRNCSRHPDAPHGQDGAGCKCHSWAPGEAS